MLSFFVETAERLALHASPDSAVRLLGALPGSAVDAMRRSRFRRTLRLAAARSPFYRDEFRRRGIDVNRIAHPAELGDFYTTGDDLRALGPERFLTGHADTAFETTGTTSPVPKQVFFSRHEIVDMGRITALWLHLLGLTPDDRVLSAFDCSFWVSPYVLRAGLDFVGCFHVEAGKIDPVEFHDRAQRYRPTVIFGEPSWLLRLAEIAREQGTWPVKFLFGGGENIAESGRRLVEEVWGAPLYLNYGQTESFGALGAECREQDGYHRNDLYFYFELLHPDADGYGELVYTTLARDVMPLIRYRSTDVSRLVEEPCACGISMGRLAKIRGRADEMVVCGMGNIGPWVFERILQGVHGIGPDWQVVIRQEDSYDLVMLHLELDAGSTAPSVEGIVRDRLREQFPDFWRNLEMRLYDLRIVGHARETLRGDGRKLRRLLDERQMMAAAIPRH